MSLNIVVCVKSTPTTNNVGIDSATGKIKSGGLVYGMNPFDEYAVEEGVRLKERVAGSMVTALTVGPDSAESVVRDAIARGCDAGAFVAAGEIDINNPYTTSYVLAQAIRKLHAVRPVHLVLFGKNSSDGYSGVVGAQTAAWLDWPGVISVKKVDAIDDKSVTVWRMMEDGTDVLKARLPACLSTTKEINEPRLPSLKGKMASKKAAIPKWTLAEVGVKPEELGTTLAGAVVAKNSPPPSRPAGMRIEGASSAEKAAKLVDLLIERKLI